MGIVFRQSIKSTIVIFTGNLIGAVATYFTAQVFSQDKQQFGFSRTLITVGVISMICILMGAASVMQTFTQRYEKRDERKKVLISLCFLAPLLMALCLLPFYLGFKAEIVAMFKPQDRAYFSDYYGWVALLVLAWGYLTLLEAYMISQHKSAQGLVMREVFLRVCNLLALGALYWQLIRFHGFIVLTVLGYVLSAILLLLLSMRTEGFGFSRRWKVFTRGEYKEIFRFAWYHLLVGVSVYLTGYLDGLLLATLDKDGVSAVPAYTIAVFIVGLMAVPYRAMAQAVFPALNRAYIERNDAELRDIFNRSGINILIVAVAMAFIIGLNLNNAASILPKGYEKIVPLSLILMLGRAVDMATGVNTEMISISIYYKFNFRISAILVVLIVVLCWLLIPRYGAYGAAWGSSIALTIFNIAKLIFLKKKMALHPFSLQSLKVILAGIVSGLIAYFIPYLGNPVVDALLRAGTLIIIYTPLLLWWRVSPDINEYLATVVKKKRLF
ncbi:polysaccharide biosynthesis C-terminal domain-containing protein [Taibaiella koreensis]|uniref:polysaccharide biosynthesis C-terminal domain-containing protein n=1 Tax=Taibaiella koreensis TaxID=1268548 RepID=UPI000E59C37E|nr:oligosaccharide flippase family protein [Taibaiella koreensis]